MTLFGGVRAPDDVRRLVTNMAGRDQLTTVAINFSLTEETLNMLVVELNRYPSVTSLNLRGPILPRDISALAKLQHITYLDLSGNNMGPQNVDALQSILSTTPVARLDFSDNSLGSEVAESLRILAARLNKIVYSEFIGAISSNTVPAASSSRLAV